MDEDKLPAPTPPLAKSKSTKQTARVSHRKRMKRTKERGRYKPKPKTAAIGIDDPDLVGCIFSDDDVQADYLDQNQLVSELGEEDCRPTEVPSEDKRHFTMTEAEDTVDEMAYSDASSSVSGSTSESSASSSQQSSISSRPASAAESDCSRPESSMSAAVETTLSVDSDSASRPETPSDSCASASTSREGPPPCNPLFDLFGVVTPEDNLSLPPVSLKSINLCLEKFRKLLPKAWIPICDGNSFHLLLLSYTLKKAIQRQIIVSFHGLVSINVHCENIFANQVLSKYPVPSLHSEEDGVLQEFCEKSVHIVHSLMDFEVCLGANHEETRNVWHTIPQTIIDKNPYQENHYKETCRSDSCLWLVRVVKGKAARCENCSKIYLSLRRRKEFLQMEEVHPSTANIFLTPTQAVFKLRKQHREIKNKDKAIAYLKKKVKESLDEDGVDIEDHLSAALNHILSSTKLTEVQKMFLQEQLTSAGKKDKRSHRWHPTMIRLALHIKSKMTESGFEALRDSGAINLPSSRTLFDYSHAIDRQEGVSDGILQIVSDQVKSFKPEYQKYHVLLCDEIYISQNLVYRQSDNTLVGYAYLDEVEKELEEFDNYVENQFSGKKQQSDPKIAKTVLAFMVKGMASNIKYVVASFPVKDLSAETLYARSWQVIKRLEKAGIKILAYVCDGAPTNRAFIKMHTPLTQCKSKVIFDTINFCSPERRPLYFISDVCHLIKTIRNCLYNSGDNKTRCMEINGEKLLWKTIVRLYLTYKNSNFRKSYKLNAQVVFPDKFSCMSVKNAAAVLSETVAQNIEDEKWPGTSELVKFIRYVNRFFDCMNGAYKIQDIRTRNKYLAPYTSADDRRLDWLGVPDPKRQGEVEYQAEENDSLNQPFLEYLNDWANQVNAMKIEAKLKAKKVLAHQTLYGIEMAIRGFAGAIRFLFQELKEPPKFILGRVFSQDPLEQHFSVQRGACGGSRNPNYSQFQSKQVHSAVERDIGIKSRRANSTETTQKGLKVSEEPLPKRRRVSKK